MGGLGGMFKKALTGESLNRVEIMKATIVGRDRNEN